MKTTFPKEEKPELVKAARLAAAGPEHDDFFTQLAEYFDRQRKTSSALVAPKTERRPA